MQQLGGMQSRGWIHVVVVVAVVAVVAVAVVAVPVAGAAVCSTF